MWYGFCVCCSQFPVPSPGWCVHRCYPNLWLWRLDGMASKWSSVPARGWGDSECQQLPYGGTMGLGGWSKSWSGVDTILLSFFEKIIVPLLALWMFEFCRFWCRKTHFLEHRYFGVSRVGTGQSKMILTGRPLTLESSSCWIFFTRGCHVLSDGIE